MITNPAVNCYFILRRTFSLFYHEIIQTLFSHYNTDAPPHTPHSLGGIKKHIWLGESSSGRPIRSAGARCRPWENSSGEQVNVSQGLFCISVACVLSHMPPFPIQFMPKHCRARTVFQNKSSSVTHREYSICPEVTIVVGDFSTSKRPKNVVRDLTWLVSQLTDIIHRATTVCFDFNDDVEGPNGS